MKNEYDDFADEPKNPYELTEMWMDDMVVPTETFLQSNYHDLWRKWLRLDFGDQWDMYMQWDAPYKSSADPATQITVNMIGPPIRQLRAYATARRSYISCKPTQPQAHIAAILAEKGVNYEWKRNKFHKQVKDAFLEAAIVGFCWGEVGWTTIVDEREKPERNEKFDLRDFIRKDSGYLRKLDCFKVGYDLSAPTRNPDSGRFIYESFTQEPWYVVNNRFYDKAVRDAIRGKKEKPEAVHETNYNPDRPAPYSGKKLYTLYRVWDKLFKRMYIFCKGVKRPLQAIDWPWDYLDEFPIKRLDFIPAPYDYFPIGLPQWVEDLQYERNRIRTSMFHQVRTESGGQIYVTDELDPEEKKKLRRGEKVITGKEGIAAPTPIQTTPFPPEKFAIDAVIESDGQKIIGLPAFAQGTTNSGRRAATEIMKADQYTAMRIDDIIESLDSFVESVATDLIKHMQANYTTDRIVDIAGPLGEYWGRVTNQPPGPDGKYWVTFNREHIAGEFDIEIESTVKPKSDPITELQNLNLFFQNCERVAMMGLQAMPQGGQWNGVWNGINFFEILRTMAEKLEIRDSARYISQLAIVPVPIKEQTPFGQMGQQPPAAEPVSSESEVFEQAVNPQSEVAGALLGAFNGERQQ